MMAKERLMRESDYRASIPARGLPQATIVKQIYRELTDVFLSEAHRLERLVRT